MKLKYEKNLADKLIKYIDKKIDERITPQVKVIDTKIIKRDNDSEIVYENIVENDFHSIVDLREPHALP